MPTGPTNRSSAQANILRESKEEVDSSGDVRRSEEDLLQQSVCMCIGKCDLCVDCFTYINLFLFSFINTG